MSARPGPSPLPELPGLPSVRLRGAVTPVMGVRAASAKRILVVEDDHDLARSLADLLTDEGYAAAIAHSGADGLASAHHETPALVVLDVNLPDMDGFEVAGHMAEDRWLSPVPVLMLSGVADLPTRVRQTRRPELDFMRKPCTAPELLARIERSLAEAETREKLRRAARFDELTGLGNVRLLEERLEVEAARLIRYDTALSVVAIDLDGLKRINDEHGHATGSEVIRTLGQVLRAEIRETDLAARTGGDEFVVLLPHTELIDAVSFSQRLLRHVRELRPCGVPISVSVGVASFEPRVDASVRSMLARADAASYEAKRQGGNRLAVAAGDGQTPR